MKRLFALCLLAAGAAHAVPTPAEVRASYRASEAVLLDRHGEPLDALRIDMKARRLPWVALSDMSASLPIAVMQAEDQRFLQHSGVDYAAIGRAALDNLFRTKARGASTITMQLAGLLDPALQAGASGRTLGQKWNQARAAQELEAGWTKQQILEAYLNLAPFRGEVRGVAASSRTLFGKAPSGLNRTEAIILASLLRAPMATQRVLTRRACGLARELKFDAPCSAIDWEVAKALSHPAALVVLTPAPQVAQKLLKVGNVTSTLDGDLQRFAQSALRQQLLALRERNVRDGAIIVLDNDSGEILAYVGNAGNSEVDGVMALRQAGSTLKPFLYELAIERKLITAASVLDDSPVDIPTAAGMYVPQNYDKEFKGKVSTRTSLASSLNVPAVRTLLMTGLDRFYNRLREVGITTLDQPSEYYGYSLALGSAEVNLLELANAYRVLASGGLAGQATLQAHATPRRRVLDQGAAFIVGDILSDRAARSLTFGLKNELATTYWSAVKTGTSKDMRDNWSIGFSSRYTVGVWVGNFDGASMWDVSGVTGAAPVWRDVMDYLHQHQPSAAPVPPAGVLRRTVHFEPALEPGRPEWFIDGTEADTVTVLADARQVPRIVYPGSGSIIAIDPDIPREVERVYFQAQAGQGLQWQLDGEVLGSASASLPWRPAPGKHVLALVDGQQQSVAQSHFVVRGSDRAD